MLVLAVLSFGCERPGKIVSSENASWGGFHGTAITITQTQGTKYLEGIDHVAFQFRSRTDEHGFWGIADLTFPLMKVESHSVKVFFPDDPSSSLILSHLPEALQAGTVLIVPCHPNRVC